jgi:hypothetical protein
MYSKSVTQTKISYYGEIMETKPFLRLACVDRVPSFRGDAKDLVAVGMVIWAIRKSRDDACFCNFFFMTRQIWWPRCGLSPQFLG